MTWTAGPAFSGESRDNDAEVISAIRSSSVACDSTAARLVSPGTRCLLFNTGTDNAKAILPAFGDRDPTPSSNMLAFTGYVGLSALPSAEIGLISNATQGGRRYVRIGTDGLIRFYNNGGTQIGPTGTTAISTTGMTKIGVFYDFISFTGSTVNACLIRLYIAGKEELMFVVNSSAVIDSGDTGNDLCWGEWISGTNRGANLYGAHLNARDSTSVNDSPHLVPYPDFLTVGGATLPPTSDGSHTAWTGTFADVDDYPNDGAGTFINSTTTNSTKETFKYSASNPITSSMTVDAVGLRVVCRISAAGKSTADVLLRDASANETTNAMASVGTTYVGNAPGSPDYRMRKPGGDGTGRDWVYTDFDLSAGSSNLQFGGVNASAGSVGMHWTNITGPIITYSTSYLQAGRYPGGFGQLVGLSPFIG